MQPFHPETIIRVLRERGPLSTTALAAHIKRERSRTLEILRPLRDAGRVKNTNQSVHTVWCLPHQYEDAIDAGRARFTAKVSQRAIERRPVDLDELPDMDVVQVWRPAADFALPATLGPSSIFALAQGV